MVRRSYVLAAVVLLLGGCNGNSAVTSPSIPVTGPGAPSPSPQTQPSIVEYPTSATLLGGLAIADDDNVYFSTTTELGIFTPSTGRYTLIARPNTWPVIPKTQPTGAVASSQGTVSALGTSTTSTSTAFEPKANASGTEPALVRFTIASNAFSVAFGSAGDVFEDVTMTADGTSWVTGDHPSSGGLTGFLFTSKAGCSTLTVSDAIDSVTVGGDGFVWFASDPKLNASTTSKIFRVDPSGGTLANTYDLGARSFVSGLTPGPDGAMWFADAGLNEIGRLGTDGSVVYYPVPTPSSGLQKITTGCDGALWFTERAANKIGRITTSGSVTEYPIPTPNAGAGDIQGCLNGKVFFTETHAIGEVVLPSQ